MSNRHCLFSQVLNKLLSLANNARLVKADPRAWNNMIWNTSTFTKSIFTVTGKDMLVFMDQWVRMGGHAKFHMTFVFNRKRNTVELVINQVAIRGSFVRLLKELFPFRMLQIKQRVESASMLVLLRLLFRNLMDNFLTHFRLDLLNHLNRITFCSFIYY